MSCYVIHTRGMYFLLDSRGGRQAGNTTRHDAKCTRGSLGDTAGERIRACGCSRYAGCGQVLDRAHAVAEHPCAFVNGDNGGEAQDRWCEHADELLQGKLPNFGVNDVAVWCAPEAGYRGRGGGLGT